MDEHGPGGECRRLKQSIVLRPLPAVGIAAICVFLLTSSFHTPNAVQDGPVTEHVIQGVVKSAVVEEVAAMRAQATRGGATGYPRAKGLPWEDSSQRLPASGGRRAVVAKASGCKTLASSQQALEMSC